MSLFSKALSIYKKEGIRSTLIKCLHRLFKNKVTNYKKYQELFNNKKGLEIGGPSSFFEKHNSFPIYPVINSLDGVNFSTFTIWEGDIKNGLNYKFGNGGKGYQYICDAVDLSGMPSEKYDFILSCNSLEHVANVFKAINEWVRVIKPNGILLLVLPRKESNFDHKRSITTFEHLKSDYKNNISEDDTTHLDEILKLHDLSKDIVLHSFEEFNTRSLNNYENRCLHHHVFDLSLIKEIFNYFNLDTILTNNLDSVYVFIGRKKQ